jgi:hypothetical protein
MEDFKAINTGDLIAVRKGNSLLGRATQFFTRSAYTHAGVAIWIEGVLYVAELNGGRNHLIPISQLKDFDVYECPVPLEGVRTAIHKWLQTPVDYGFAALFAIGLLDWFKIKMFVHWRKILVCSGFCVAIYETAGWPEHTRIISPAQLASELKLKLEVRPPPKVDVAK